MTGHTTSSLGGVYKLASYNETPTLKISENVEKTTLPGIKRTVRFINDNGQFAGDGIFLDEEPSVQDIHHPYYPAKKADISYLKSEPLMNCVMKNGERIISAPSAGQSAEYTNKRFRQLNSEHKRFQNPHIYKVGIGKKLMDLRDRLKHKVDPTAG